MLLATENLQQGRLPRPILTHKSYAVPVVHNETRIGKQRFYAKFYFQVFYGNHFYVVISTAKVKNNYELRIVNYEL